MDENVTGYRLDFVIPAGATGHRVFKVKLVRLGLQVNKVFKELQGQLEQLGRLGLQEHKAFREPLASSNIVDWYCYNRGTWISSDCYNNTN